MIKKRILDAGRIRRIDGSFSFVPHRVLTGGFLAALAPEALLLYFFLVLAGDRHGLSFYSYDSICNLLHLSVERYVKARNELIQSDLIAFDGIIFQVLELPAAPPPAPTPAPSQPAFSGLIKNLFPEVP
mgnify:CR=1 FL=1